MIPEDVLASVMELGLSKAQAAAFSKALKRVEEATKQEVEEAKKEEWGAPLRRRRGGDALRQRRAREKRGREGKSAAEDLSCSIAHQDQGDSQRHVTSRDVTDVSPPKKEISPQTPLLEKNSPPLDSIDEERREAAIAQVSNALGGCCSAQTIRNSFPAVEALISDGCDFELDVLPELADIARKLSGRGTSLRTLHADFVARQICERRDIRRSAQSTFDSAPSLRATSEPEPTALDPGWLPDIGGMEFANDRLGRDGAFDSLNSFRQRFANRSGRNWPAAWRAWILQSVDERNAGRPVGTSADSGDRMSRAAVPRPRATAPRRDKVVNFRMAAARELYAEEVARASAISDDRAARIAPDWMPAPDDRRLAEAEIGADAVDRELAKFRDYWLAKPGPGATKLDWGATWRTWVRRAAEQIASAGPAAGNSGRYGGNPEKSVHAAARKLCDDVASGRFVFGPIPPSAGELLARERARTRAGLGEPLIGRIFDLQLAAPRESSGENLAVRRGGENV
jgi:hypothetical protein